MICVMGILGFEGSCDCNVHMLVELSKMSCKFMVGDEQGSLRHSLFVLVVVSGVDANCGAVSCMCLVGVKVYALCCNCVLVNTHEHFTASSCFVSLCD